jgi:hypothetical protein
MIIYTWRLCGLITEPSYDGLEDFVNRAQWQLTATDDTTLHSAWTAHTWQALVHDPAQPYVARNELTDELVLGWIQAALGDDYINTLKAELASQIPPAEAEL